MRRAQSEPSADLCYERSTYLYCSLQLQNSETSDYS